MYQEGMVASTHPNRQFWVSGSINTPGTCPSLCYNSASASRDLRSPGGNTPVSAGGPVIDNSITPGCEMIGGTGANYSCFPCFWKTFPEYLQDSGVDWRFYDSLES
jgi:phospholipase C